MVTRLRLVLEPSEYAALVRLSQSELRNPADQVRHVLREALTQRGLLPTDASENAKRDAASNGGLRHADSKA